MRRLIIVLVIVAVLLLASPLLTGQIAEKELRSASNRLSRQIGSMDVVEVDYQRGWLDSETNHKFVIPAALMGGGAAGEADTGLAMHTEVMHGPMIVGGGDPNLPAVSIALVVSKTTFTLDDGGENVAPFEVPGVIYNRLELDGSGTMWGVFEGIEKQLSGAWGENTMLNWGGGEFETSYNAGQTEVKGKFATEPFSIESPEGSMAMGKSSGTGDWTQGPFGLWIGKTKAMIESLEVSGMEGEAIAMTGFEMDASAAMQGEDKMAASVIMTIADLDVPEFNETKLRVPIDLTGLNAETLSEMKLVARDSSGNPEDATINLLRMQELSNELVQHGFGLSVPGFQMETQRGDASLDFTFDFPASNQAGQAAMMAALVAATGSAELRLDRTLFDYFSADNPQMQMQAQGMIAAGFITEEDGALIINAGYEGGLLTVNGLPIPLPMPVPTSP